jgi:hypothetical protein
LHGDLRVTDTGQIGTGAGVADVRVDTPEGKRQGDQGKKNLDDSLVIANGVKEHGVAR